MEEMEAEDEVVGVVLGERRVKVGRYIAEAIFDCGLWNGLGWVRFGWKRFGVDWIGAGWVDEED